MAHLRQCLRRAFPRSTAWVANEQHVTALKSQPVFVSHVRTELNFLKSNLDPEMVRPPSYPKERWVSGFKRQDLYRHLFLNDQLNDMVQLSVALALLSGALGTFMWLVLDHQQWAYNHVSPVPFETTLSQTRDAVRQLISAFKFFPIFLLIGYMKYATTRWSKFIEYGYSVQGRIHDVALITGGAVLDGKNPKTRAMLYKLYRYLNLAHLLLYKSKSVFLSRLSDADLIKMGLLTEGEAAALAPASNKKRDLVLGWISAIISSGVTGGLLNEQSHNEAVRNVAACRGKMAAFHDRVMMYQPNVLVALMKVVVDLLILVYVVGSPWTAFMNDPTLGCFQMWTLLSTFFLCFPLICASYILEVVDTPFNVDERTVNEVYNVDALMGSSEQCIFHSLRTSFDPVWDPAYIATER